MGRSHVPKESRKKITKNAEEEPQIKLEEVEKENPPLKKRKVVLVDDSEEEMEDGNDENEENDNHDCEDYDDFDDKDDSPFDPNKEESLNENEMDELHEKDESFSKSHENLIIPKYHIKKMAEEIFRDMNLGLKVSSKARSLIHLHCEAFLIDIFQQSSEIMDLHKVKTLNKKVLSKVFEWKSKSLLHMKKRKACKHTSKANAPATQCELNVAS